MIKSTPLKRFLLPIFLSLSLLLLLQRSASAQTKSFYWERYDVDITLLDNGDLRVVEEQTLNFSGEPFTFGYATIPTGRDGGNDGLEDVTVSEGDTLYSQSRSNSMHTFEVVEESGQVVINWYFPPAVGQRTYTFSYTAKGAVRVGEEGDQIFWKAIPADHPAYVAAGRVTIHLPSGVEPQRQVDTGEPLIAAYVGGTEDDTVAIGLSEDGRRITYEMSEGLAVGEMLEVRVQFPHGQLPIETSNWQRQEQIADAMGLVVLAVAILIVIGGPLAVLLLWYLRGRDPEVGPMADILAEPPDSLPPAVVGTLIDEKADMQDVVSTLVDLARRGYLTMTEEKGSDYQFTRTDKPTSDLRPFEQQFLTHLFGRHQSRELNDLKYKFAQHLPGIRSAMYEELKREGLFARSPQGVRNSYLALGVAVLVVAGLGFVALPAALGELVATAVCPALALGLTGVALLITANFMPAKTMKGAEASAKWQAFKKYLQEVERHTKLEEAGEIFEKFLAYAIAFGLERSWIRKFATLPTTPIPPWYVPYPHPYYGGGTFGRMGGGSSPASGGGPPSLEGMSRGLTGGLENMSAGLTRMLSSTATILKSTPPSTSSGGRVGGGFSGGFGGGFSGGGGSRGFG